MNGDELFKLISRLVESGLGIKESCKVIGVSSSTLYRKLSEEQKRELQYLTTLNTKYGVGSRYDIK